MTIERKKTIYIGIASILVAIGFQLFNDFACYKRNIIEALLWLWFPSIPLIPAISALKSKNPLRAVPSALCVIPFYMMAYYTDCIQPYQGGGASMIYVVVIVYGTPVAFAGLFLADLICRIFKIEIIRTDAMCKSCGAIVKPADNYCQHCGKKISEWWWD